MAPKTRTHQAIQTIASSQIGAVREVVVTMDDLDAPLSRYTDQSLSTIHHTLRASRRRLAIALVAHRAISPRSSDDGISKAHEPSRAKGDIVSVRQLAREIVSIENDVSVEHATGEQYHNVYTSLIQTHLPKLDDIGAVQYNADRKMVAPDRNLYALAVAAAITSPVAQILFHNAVADLYSGGTTSMQDAIDD